MHWIIKGEGGRLADGTSTKLCFRCWQERCTRRNACAVSALAERCNLWAWKAAEAWLRAVALQGSVGVALLWVQHWTVVVAFFFFSAAVLRPPGRWVRHRPPRPLLFCSRFPKTGIIAGGERPVPFANGYSNDPLGRQRVAVDADVSRCHNISISLNIEATAFSYWGGGEKNLATFQKWLNVCEMRTSLSLSFSLFLSPLSNHFLVLLDLSSAN